MIKNFECYVKKEAFSNKTTQWYKHYADGSKALLVIEDNRITRANVRKAFELLEHGIEHNVYTSKNLHWC